MGRALRRLFRPRRVLRLTLLVGVPLLAGLVALNIYARGGRFVVTENAYVKANIVAVSAVVEGHVVDVAVRDNQLVQPGTVLFRIDPVPYEIAVAEAEAEMDVVRSDIEQLRFDYREAVLEADEAKERLRFLERQFARQKQLKQQRMGSEENYDEALHELNTGRQRLQMLDERIQRTLANLQGDVALPVEKHPRYRRSMTLRDQAAMDLTRTTIVAPARGVVSNMKLQAGEYVKEGTAVFSLIETEPVWIEANLKETQLTHVVVGQDATIEVDAYPDREWRASVDTIAPATGAEFALLPPQNASGNWVKVVQRVPVLLRIEPHADAPVLRAGMTAAISIDTHRERELPGFLAGIVARPGLPHFLRKALALDQTKD
jgi:membrane fusion protein (multidrug efflux system)